MSDAIKNPALRFNIYGRNKHNMKIVNLYSHGFIASKKDLRYQLKLNAEEIIYTRAVIKQSNI